MKRLFLIVLSLIVIFVARAQVSTEFTQTINGVTLTYNIIDQANRHVEVKAQQNSFSLTPPILTFPEAVYKPGETEPYTITKIAIGIFDGNWGSWSGATGTITLTFPSSLETIEWMAFAHAYGVDVVDLSKCTKLKELVGLNFHRGTISKLYLPEGIERIGEHIFDDNKLESLDLPSTINELGSYAFDKNRKLKVVNLRKLPAVPIVSSTYSPFINAHPDLKIYVNTDLSASYATATGWSNEIGKYVETIDMNASGYTTFYLENENFKVPDGCTAYIITGVTPSGNIATPDNAIVKAFTAGKIIPKQTGFILQGTPNTTIEYRAAVAGIEEDVTGNLLVGTATEREISGAGYKYYVLSNSGDQGLGFYKQGTRAGVSIKLTPHRAGLRLPATIARAKRFIVDFDAAREEAETTGIRDIRPVGQPKDNAVYDLQGRRVKNPTRGIYIVNGKKVIINK